MDETKTYMENIIKSYIEENSFNLLTIKKFLLGANIYSVAKELGIEEEIEEFLLNASVECKTNEDVQTVQSIHQMIIKNQEQKNIKR